jgi:hypothetical protein
MSILALAKKSEVDRAPVSIFRYRDSGSQS